MRFKVRAFSGSEGIQVAYWDAANESDVRLRATTEGLEVLEISTATANQGIRSHIFSSPTFPTRQFAQEFTLLLEAGFGLVETFETLLAKERNAYIRTVVDGVYSSLKSGDPLSRALERFPREFPPLLIETVRSAEHTGDLAKAMRRYLKYEEQLASVRAHAVAASVYPIILLVSGAMVVAFMLLYVVPRLAGAYESVRDQAPALSRWLFLWGDLVSAHAWAIGGLLVLAALAGFGVLTNTALRAAMVRTIMSIPGLGEQVRTYHLTRMYRTTGMLLDGGMPLVRALALARGSVPDAIRQDLESASSRIAQGQSLATAFESSGLSTVVANRMFIVGERSGNLGGTLERIAEFHEAQQEQSIKRFVRVFEPALMILMGLLIGGIVLLMYMPIFELAGSVQ